jgi:hypothetical protein
MNLSILKRVFYGMAAIFLFVAGLPVLAAAGAKIKIDDTKFFQIGMGLRASLTVEEDAATNGTDSSFNPAAENIRLYTVSQVHKNIQVEFNTERNAMDIEVLDVIAKLDLGVFDLWVGRQLPPSDRSNMDGPYYLNAAWMYPTLTQSFGMLGCAGCNGRDDGIAIHGEVNGGKFKWAYGVFEGLVGGADQEDNVRHAASLTYAFDDAEPGFYSGSTYFGAKKITTLNLAMHLEEDGVGSSATDKGDFTGFSADVLIERTLGNGAVVDLEGGYYNWDTDDKFDNTITQGDSFLVLASYLMPNKVSLGGIGGQLQPYTRYQGFNRDMKNDTGKTGYTDSMEAGLNFVIDGFNAKVTALWQQTDDVTAVDKYVLGMQFQL